MLPFWMPATTAGGSASASTFNPTASAVVGIDGGADHLVHAQRVGPLGLVAERVEAEDLLALGDQRRMACGGVVIVVVATAGDDEAECGDQRAGEWQMAWRCNKWLAHGGLLSGR